MNKISFKDGSFLAVAAAGVATLIASMFGAFDSKKPPSPKEEKEAQRQLEVENKKKIRQAQLRAKVFKRARGRCEKCDEKRPLNVFYIVSPYNNGRCTYNNLQGLCSTCGKAQSRLS